LADIIKKGRYCARDRLAENHEPNAVILLKNDFCFDFSIPRKRIVSASVIAYTTILSAVGAMKNEVCSFFSPARVKMAKLNLRLQSALDHQYHAVRFHVVGVVREFPTAPKDSFLVVNSSYLAWQTGTDAAETVLLRVAGDRAAVAQRARAIIADLPGAKVTDLESVQRSISSSLTAISLQGLTRLELVFAVLLAAGAAGLILGLGLAERQKTFAVLKGLGADARQLGAFLWSEALFMLVPGIVIGGLLGLGVAQVLVMMLTGIFDPPPEALAIPWPYLAVLCVTVIASTVAAVIVLRIYLRGRVLETLRGL
jgi:putative ABC transport system permease protein